MLTPSELKSYEYFKHLAEDSRAEISSKIERVNLPSGTRIIRQGTPPDFFYFIEKGELEVTKRNKFGQVAKLIVLNSGQVFGETALLTCSHRTSSITTMTDCTLLRLSKKHFEEIVLMDSTIKSMLTEISSERHSFYDIKSYQPFALLEPEKMMTLTEKLREETYGPGVDIITQGDPMGPFYIIKSGRVEVLKMKPGKEPQKVAELGTGESFGEEAIIREQGRGATVRTTEPTNVLALDKKDFNKMLKSSFLEFSFPEDIPLDTVSRYVFIDARVPPEYLEEHIEGAINIPVEQLRKKYKEFDPDQEYITYCTNDSRGMTAAFLMRSNGLKASCLRGGLSGWEGEVVHGSDGIHLPS